MHDSEEHVLPSATLCAFSDILSRVNTCIFNLLGDYSDSNVPYMNLLQMTPPRKKNPIPQWREKRERKSREEK